MAFQNLASPLLHAAFVRGMTALFNQALECRFGLDSTRLDSVAPNDTCRSCASSCPLRLPAEMHAIPFNSIPFPQAVFFSYLGPDNRTDNGRTRHSGCPIIEGTKWIATLWMRRGVDGVKGWQYYDPSGQPSA